MVKCDEVPRLPRKTTSQPVFKPSTKKGFAASPQKPATRDERDTLDHENEHFARDFLTFHTLQLQNRRFPTSFLTNRPQNRRFVRGFRRFSSHVTKCYACHGICILSPLRATLTMRFAENTQHDTSKVLCLPREMTLEVSKVLRLPPKNAAHLLKTSQT